MMQMYRSRFIRLDDWFLCSLAMRHHSSRQESSTAIRYLPGHRDLCGLGSAAYTGA